MQEMCMKCARDVQETCKKCACKVCADVCNDVQLELAKNDLD